MRRAKAWTLIPFRHLYLSYVANERVAVHINYSPERSPPEGITVSSLTAKEEEGLKRGEDFVKMGAAYSLEHATRPSTIGLVLGSSPMALLAWIGEKFLAWSDEDPDLETILESVTLYWLTETFPTSIYPYRLVRHPFPISAIDPRFRLICPWIEWKVNSIAEIPPQLQTHTAVSQQTNGIFLFPERNHANSQELGGDGGEFGVLL